MARIETVKDLITALLEFNMDAKVCGGDNFGNRISLGWSGGEGCAKKDCEYLCIDIIGHESVENVTKSCGDCIHNYHCAMTADGYMNYDPDTCEYNPDNKR